MMTKTKETPFFCQMAMDPPPPPPLKIHGSAHDNSSQREAPTVVRVEFSKAKNDAKNHTTKKDLQYKKTYNSRFRLNILATLHGPYILHTQDPCNHIHVREGMVYL